MSNENILKNFENSFQTVFEIGKVNDIFIVFLFRMFEVSVMDGDASSNPYHYRNTDFVTKIARKIVEDLFTQQEKDRIKKLINELEKKNPPLIELARLEEEAELKANSNSYAYPVFNEVRELVPDSLTILALIKIDSSNFKKSHKFLIKMWEQLQRSSPKENEPDNKPDCNLGALKVCVWDALDDLEKLVNDEQKQNQTEENNESEKEKKQNIEEYLKSICEKIRRELAKEAVKENELDAEIQAELTSLKNGDFGSKELIDEIEKKISDNIKLKKAEKELNKLLGSYNQKFSPKSRERLLKKFNEFTKNNSPFYQQVYQKRKAEIEKMIKQLEDDGLLQQINSAKDSFPLAVKSMIGGYLLLTLVIIFKKMPKLRK